MAGTLAHSDDGVRTSASFRIADDIPNLIANANADPESRLESLPTRSVGEEWSAFKSLLSEDYGLNFSVAYAYVFQGANGGSDWSTGSGGQAEFDFTWTAFGREGNGMKGLFGGKVESRHKVLNATAPQSVAPRAGSVWTGALGYGELDPAVSQLWYEHHFVRDRVLARAGKISPFTVFDYYKYKSPRVASLGQVQNFNPTIPFPPSALGLAGGVRLENGGYVAGGIFDANGRPNRAGFDTLFRDGELFAIAEVGWTPDFNVLLKPGEDFRPGNDDVHMTFWHKDAQTAAGRPDGWGVTGSIQKGFDDLVPFVRYGYSNGGATSLEHMVSTGIGIEDILGFSNDVIGMSAAWGRPSNASLGDQYSIEAFYRMQLTDNLQISPDVQLIFNPALDPGTDILTVLSLRMRLAF